jgi:hypothetical protein
MATRNRRNSQLLSRPHEPHDHDAGTALTAGLSVVADRATAHASGSEYTTLVVSGPARNTDCGSAPSGDRPASQPGHSVHAGGGCVTPWTDAFERSCLPLEPHSGRAPRSERHAHSENHQPAVRRRVLGKTQCPAQEWTLSALTIRFAAPARAGWHRERGRAACRHLGQEPQHEIAVLLQQGILAAVPTIPG